MEFRERLYWKVKAGGFMSLTPEELGWALHLIKEQVFINKLIKAVEGLRLRLVNGATSTDGMRQ